MGGVAIPVVRDNFGKNQSYSGTIGTKTDFRDPSGTQVRNPGLSLTVASMIIHELIRTLFLPALSL